MAALAVVEHRSSALPAALRWRSFEVSGATAYQPAARQPAAGTELPTGIIPSDPPATTPVTAPVRADAVVIGKYDHGRQARMRGFYGEEQVSVRVQAGSREPGRSHGVSRSVRAAELVAAHCPGLAPALRDHGSVFGGRTAYLVEQIVDGAVPVGKDGVLAALTAVARDLGSVQRAVGLEPRRLSSVLPADFPEHWQAVVEDGLVPPDSAAAVDRLVARDDNLDVSFTHGDLVATNILRVPGGVILVDWEFAGFAPVAFDLAKLHINAGPPGPAVDLLDRTLKGAVGHRRGHYTLAEQLLLGHVEVISRLERRMSKARRTRRVPQLQRQTRRRVRALGELLALG